MKLLLAAFLLLAALPQLAAQTPAWRYETQKPITFAVADGSGGCIALTETATPGTQKAIWLTKAGVKKAEFDLHEGADLGPFMVTSTRFYMTVFIDGSYVLRKYKLGKGGAVTFTDTPLGDAETQAWRNFAGDDKTGFFVYGGTTSGFVARYLHGP